MIFSKWFEIVFVLRIIAILDTCRYQYATVGRVSVFGSELPTSFTTCMVLRDIPHGIDATEMIEVVF